jgi:hypothetical protein
MRRFVNLHENILRQVLRLGGVAQRPVNHVRHRLFVLVHQLGKSSGIALLYAKHQGGVGVRIDGHQFDQAAAAI